jgi:hypothetical protein
LEEIRFRYQMLGSNLSRPRRTPRGFSHLRCFGDGVVSIHLLMDLPRQRDCRPSDRGLARRFRSVRRVRTPLREGGLSTAMGGPMLGPRYARAG